MADTPTVPPRHLSPTTVGVPDELASAWLTLAMAEVLREQAVEETDLASDPDEELFSDHQRGRGSGFFQFGEEERASRRVDLRTPSDDPGEPIPMEEASVVADAIELRFND